MKIKEQVIRLGNAVPDPVADRLTSTSLGARLLRPIINRCVPSGPTAIVVRSGAAKGIRLFIDPGREKFYWTGTHEPHVQQALVSLLKPGMTFWDVGAHIGFFTLLASRLVGRSGQVRAFEPMPQTRERLEKSIKLNHVKNVFVQDCALGSTDADSILHVPTSTTMSTLIPQTGDYTRYTVQCRTLNQIAYEFSIPDVVKIDAEGAELDVIRGGLELLSAHHPTLLVEFTNNQILTEAQALLPRYRFSVLGSNHWLLR
jgi:FkbM family methyltransferase